MCKVQVVPGKLPPRKIASRSGSGFGLGLALELGLGAIFFGDNFPRTSASVLCAFKLFYNFSLYASFITKTRRKKNT